MDQNVKNLENIIAEKDKSIEFLNNEYYILTDSYII